MVFFDVFQGEGGLRYSVLDESFKFIDRKIAFCEGFILTAKCFIAGICWDFFDREIKRIDDDALRTLENSDLILKR